MAYLYIQPFKGRLDFGVSYVSNEKKTTLKSEDTAELDVLYKYVSNADKTMLETQYFVTGINCNKDDAVHEFVEVQKRFGKEYQEIKAHHGWQSFPKDLDISPETVHKLGVKFAREQFGDRFQVVVSTHLDRNHLHNHLFINSVSFVDGKKFYGNKTTMSKLRMANDRLCREYGLPVIEKPGSSKFNNGLNKAEKRGQNTWRDLIKVDIDRAISNSKNILEFKKFLKDCGYEFKAGKHFAASPPGLTKQGNRAYIRLDSLKDARYNYQGIEDRLKGKRIRNYGVFKNHGSGQHRKPLRNRRKLPRFIALYYKYLYQLGYAKKYPPRLSYYQRAKNERLAISLNKSIRFIHNNNIKTDVDLEKALKSIDAKLDILLKQRKALYNKKADTLDITNEIKNLREEKKAAENIKIIKLSKEERLNLENKSASNVKTEEQTKEEKRYREEKKL